MNESLRLYYLQQLGITPWKLREAPAIDPLQLLANEVAACTRCPLHKARTQTVFSRGNVQAKLMIIGEAPGFYEDQQGKPFVGKAGGLLNRMLKSIGLSEEDVYIANIIKCRPPNNRDPESEEIAQCSGYLTQQIKLVDPQLILAVGRFAAQFLIGGQMPLNKMRGKLHRYEERSVIVSYHPAYLLRNPADKKKAFIDLLHVQRLCAD
jgi:uracil-DNA glycosylase family 4